MDRAISSSKILKVKNIFSAVNSGQLCFSRQAQVVKNPECKTYIQYTENFQGKRKLLKNRERLKNFQYSVYSLGGDLCNLGLCSL